MSTLLLYAPGSTASCVVFKAFLLHEFVYMPLLRNEIIIYQYCLLEKDLTSYGFPDFLSTKCKLQNRVDDKNYTKSEKLSFSKYI